MSFERKKILVLGAGYAGLQTVTKLQKILSHQDADITLINKDEYHYEATWLHETAAGTIDWEEGVYPINKVIDTQKVVFVPAEVTAIDKESQQVETTQGTFDYDILVVALGFESETFGIEGMAEHAHSLVNPQTALAARQEIERNFAKYKQSNEDKDISILVGGAGFTGIEFLGELVESIPELCERHGIDYNKVNLTCVEAAPKMLPMFPENLVEYAMQYLKDRGVNFMVGTPIVAANENGFVVEIDGEKQQLEASSIVWTAGVRGNRLMDDSFDGVKRGRVMVNADLRIEGYENIYAIGDVAAVMNGEESRPWPTTAQIAMQLADHTAKNIQLSLQGDKLQPFSYNDRGTVCSLGSKDGIGLVMGRQIKGRKAAFMKRVIDSRAIFKIGGPMLAVSKGKML